MGTYPRPQLIFPLFTTLPTPRLLLFLTLPVNAMPTMSTMPNPFPQPFPKEILVTLVDHIKTPHPRHHWASLEAERHADEARSTLAALLKTDKVRNTSRYGHAITGRGE